jgi:hypothetical protein
MDRRAGFIICVAVFLAVAGIGSLAKRKTAPPQPAIPDDAPAPIAAPAPEPAKRRPPEDPTRFGFQDWLPGFTVSGDVTAKFPNMQFYDFFESGVTSCILPEDEITIAKKRTYVPTLYFLDGKLAYLTMVIDDDDIPDVLDALSKRYGKDNASDRKYTKWDRLNGEIAVYKGLDNAQITISDKAMLSEIRLRGQARQAADKNAAAKDL